MEIKINEKVAVNKPSERVRVVLARQFIKEKEMFDSNGNVIDPNTKEIIRHNNDK